MAPNLVSVGDGAWLTWIEPIDGDRKILRLQCSKYEDGQWGDKYTIIQGSNFFANWADFPEMCVAKDGALFVTWPQKTGPGTYAYDIAVARSDDAGVTWSMMGTLNDDRVLGEHGFVSMVPDGDDGVRAFWLDGRAMSGEGHSGEGGGDMQLRTTRIDDEVHTSTLIDDRACECCGTDAAIIGGIPVVVYRDRSENEVRDISIAALAGSPKNMYVDNWIIAGCPVNGPSIDAIGTSSVVAWYSAPENASIVHIAFRDGDVTGTPIQLSTSIMGRVDVVMIDEATAVACWLEPNDETAAVMLVTVHRDGTVTDRKQVASVSLSRNSGFPRIAKVGEGLLVVWTSIDRDKGLGSTIVPFAE